MSSDYKEHPCVAGTKDDVYLLIDKLVEGMASISKELQLVRKAIENNARNHPCVPGTVAQEQEDTLFKPVILDFDAFLESKKNH